MAGVLLLFVKRLSTKVSQPLFVVFNLPWRPVGRIGRAFNYSGQIAVLDVELYSGS